MIKATFSNMVYAALTDHPEITQCEKTIYNYINQGVFSVNGLINLKSREDFRGIPYELIERHRSAW